MSTADALKRRAWSALDVVPVLIALLLVGGLVYSLVSLLFVGHPDIGWSEHVMADAKAIARGHFPYGDPGAGYVGMLYTPVFPAVVAVLLRITWWEGWGPFVSMVAVGATLVALGRFAWRAGGDRPTAWARVAMIVAFPLSAFTIFSTNGVFEGRTDQLAWSFFVLGSLRVVDDGLRRSDRGTRGRVVTGVLLALSVLTKQTTLAACGVVVVVAALVWWMHKPVSAESSRRSRVPFEAITMIGLLVVVLGALQIASDGFAFDLLFGVARRHARVASVRDTLELDLKLLIVPILLLVVGVLWCLVGARRQPGAKSDAEPSATASWWRAPAVVTTVAAGIIGVSTVPGIVLAQTKQGGDFNALAGPVWGMTVILAVALVAAPREWSRDAVRAIGVLLLVASVVPFASEHDNLRRFDDRAYGAPSLDITRDWKSVPRDLVAAADRDDTVFDWAYPSYSVAADGPSYPGGGAPPDHAAAGYAPRWIVRDLLAGRWDRVRLYPVPPGEELGIIDVYASGYGQRDTTFAWKINYLIKHGYTRVANERAGEDFYTPGPRLVDGQGLAKCFGPYEAGPLQIRVRAEGGLWCIHGDRLSLDDSPNPTSELVLESSVPVTFTVDADDPDRVQITCDQEGPTVIRVRVGSATRACGGSATLVVDVDAQVTLRGFRAGGKDVPVKLHNPTPGDL